MTRLLIVSGDEVVVSVGASIASPSTQVRDVPDVVAALSGDAIDEADVVVLDGRDHDRRSDGPTRTHVDVEGIQRRRPTVALLWIRRVADGGSLDPILDASNGHRGPFDVLLDPFEPLELLVRLRILTDRLDARADIEIGSTVIDATTRTLRRDGRTVALARREFDLLWLLASHPGRVFARHEILQRVWGDDYDGTERTVDVRVAHLRRALGPSTGRGGPIETVRGIGYRLDASKLS